MEWTANRLIPAILGGGVVLGLLASTAVNTLPKAAAEPEWRLAAREIAFRPPSYAIVDQGPMDLSPRLPWIGTAADGSVAPMPEDFYRGRIIPISADNYAVIRELGPRRAGIETADYSVDERPAEIRDDVDEPTVHKALAEVSDEPRFKTDGLPSSSDRPGFSDESEEDDAEADFGG
jgi:hypothetical protein